MIDNSCDAVVCFAPSVFLLHDGGHSITIAIEGTALLGAFSKDPEKLIGSSSLNLSGSMPRTDDEERYQSQGNAHEFNPNQKLEL
jgi:hypothetical protein